MKARGGVGSFDESFQSALVRGAPFIQIDNVKGRLDSSFLEAYLTADRSDRIPCRIPYRAEVYVRPGDAIVTLTGNEVQLTSDLASRMWPIRIIKPPPEHKYPTFSEGDTLDHLRENQGYYLSCTHTVMKEWFNRGCPPDSAGRLRFKYWVCCVEYIVKEIFGLDSPSHELDFVQSLKVDPVLEWLNISGERFSTDRFDKEFLRTGELIAISLVSGISLPMYGSHRNDEETAQKVLGRALGIMFEKKIRYGLQEDGFTGFSGG